MSHPYLSSHHPLCSGNYDAYHFGGGPPESISTPPPSAPPLEPSFLARLWSAIQEILKTIGMLMGFKAKEPLPRPSPPIAHTPLMSASAAPSLKEHIEAEAKKEGFIWFYTARDNPDTSFLGNFYTTPVTYGGITYKCSEGAYQAQKFTDPSVKKYIATLDGKEAWKYAQNNTQTNRKFSRLAVMDGVLKAKFADPTLKALLLATGSAYLVEHNRKAGEESYWSDAHDGSGDNHLGQALMELRQSLGGTGIVPPPSKYTQFLKSQK